MISIIEKKIKERRALNQAKIKGSAGLMVKYKVVDIEDNKCLEIRISIKKEVQFTCPCYG